MFPDGTFRELGETEWLLTRSAIEALLVKDAERQACLEQLASCQKELVGTEPTPGFLSTPRGKVIVIGGVSVVVTTAFVGGALFARSLTVK